MNSMWESLITIAAAITGVAIIAVIVSKNSATAQVLQAGGSAFSNALAVAVSPVTGRPANINTSYPGGSLLGGQFTPSMINS